MNSALKQAPKIPPESEQQFQAAVIALAAVHGYLIYHTHDSRRSQAGFPDLFLCRPARRGDAKPSRVLALELKTEKGKASRAQQLWIDSLNLCGIPAYVFRPSQKQQIAEILR